MGKNIIRLLVVICYMCIMPHIAYSRPMKSVAPPPHTSFTKERPLKIVGSWDFCPLSFIKENGQATGLAVEITKYLLDKLDIPYIISLEYKEDAYLDIKKGKANLSWGTYKAASRKGLRCSKQCITYLVPSIAFRKGRKHTNDFKKISSDSFCIVNCVNNDSVSYEDIKKDMYNIANGEYKQIVWNSLGLQNIKRTYHFQDIIIEPLYNVPSFAYSFVSNDSVLLDKLDSIYIIEKMNGHLLPIYNKWLYPERHINIVPDWVFSLIWITIGVLVVMIIFHLIFRIKIKKENKTVRQRNNRIQLALKSGNVTLWLYDVKQDTYHSYHTKKEKNVHATGEDLRHYMSDEDYEIIKIKIKLLSDGRSDFETYIYSCNYNTSDGRMHKYSVSAGVLKYDKDRKPRILLGTVKDISNHYERIAMEKDMLLRYSTIFRSAMIACAQVDKDGYYVDVNDKWCEFFGIKDKSKIFANKLHVTDIWGGYMEGKGYKLSQTLDIIDFDKMKNDYDVLIKREGISFLEHRIVPLYGDKGEYYGYNSSFIDSTEKNNAIEKLSNYVGMTKDAKDDIERCAERLNQIIAGGGISIFSFKPKSQFMEICDDLISDNKILPRKNILDNVTADYKKIAKDWLYKLDNGLDEIFSLNVDFLNNNEVEHREITGMPEYSADGKISTYFGVIRDISKLVETQRMMEKKKKEAETANLLKSAFIKNMSFEIRTPLQDILGFAGLLDNATDKKEHEFFVKQITDNTTKLLSLVNDILVLSKFDAQMVEVKNKITDFSVHFNSVCESNKGKITHPDVDFIYQGPYSKCIVDIDIKLVSVMIEKILDNAIKYTDKGYVKAEYEYKDNGLRIIIEDTGRGIPEEIRSKLFERFVKSGNTTFSEGLGLSFCNEIIKLLGGSISYQSEINKGTTFEIFIPCHANEIVEM